MCCFREVYGLLGIYRNEFFFDFFYLELEELHMAGNLGHTCTVNMVSVSRVGSHNRPFAGRVHVTMSIIKIGGKFKGGETCTKWLLWTTSNHHILGSLTSLGLNFGHVCSIEGFFNF